MKKAGKLRYWFWKDVGVPALLTTDRIRHKARKAMSKRRPRPSWAGPPLECAARLRTIMSRHYLLARRATPAMPIAWVTSGAPVEILRVLGYYTVYPENHGAVCGARKCGVEMSRPAEEAGFSPDLCSYARIDIGLAHGAQSPVGQLPKPDVMVCCTNICQTVLYWYKQLAHQYQIPLLLVDTPFIAGELDAATTAYMATQMRELIPPLERIAKTAFDDGAFVQLLTRARDTSLLWGRVLQTVSSRPAPMTVFDAFAHMAPVVSLRGLPVALHYYETLLQELEQRVDQGVGILTNERFRLLWDNIAVWFKLAEFYQTFSQAGAAFVAATYTNAWAETAHYLDTSQPFESMAKTYSLVVLNRDLEHRFALMERMVQDFHIDGIVFHSTRSCKPYSVGQYDMKQRFAKRLGLKSVIIEADTTDPRNYAHGPTMTRIEAFLESLERSDK